MSDKTSRKQSSERTPAPTSHETLNKAAGEYVGCLVERAEWIGQELSHCLSSSYPPNATLANGYCQALRRQLRPITPEVGQFDAAPLAEYGVEPISLLSALSRSVLGEDFPRSTSWLWRLLAELPADVWTSGEPPTESTVNDWHKATEMLRGCLRSGVLASTEQSAGADGSPQAETKAIFGIRRKWLVKHRNSIALWIGGLMILLFGLAGLLVPSQRELLWGVGACGIFLVVYGKLFKE